MIRIYKYGFRNSKDFTQEHQFANYYYSFKDSCEHPFCDTPGVSKIKGDLRVNTEEWKGKRARKLRQRVPNARIRTWQKRQEEKDEMRPTGSLKEGRLANAFLCHGFFIQNSNSRWSLLCRVCRTVRTGTRGIVPSGWVCRANAWFSDLEKCSKVAFWIGVACQCRLALLIGAGPERQILFS